ncbi:MAG: serine/threonine protein kinase, partial [bacterium]|nr:serine/threonine protein kinase [bacterium]
TFGNQLFVAMELIEGSTLRRWQAVAGGNGDVRPWRRVLEVYAQAGRGLAAAHAAGMVHRDFKPGNVMLGEDGRIRVLDFGLCVSADPAPGVAGVDGDSGRPPAGTPAYMAPEQAAGGAADARSDQFSFCCSLYEALYGVLPFAGETARDYLAEAAAGAVRPPPAGTPVPAWVWEAVARGLAVEPGDRHPSLDALVAVLERDPDARRRRWLAVAAGVAAVLALGAAGWQMAQRPSQLCRGAEARLAETWDEGRRAAIRQAFLATGTAYALESYTETARLVDAYSRDWTAMRTEACEATHVRGEQSPQLLDLRMGCLDGRLRELRELTDLFARADSSVVQKAVAAAGQLSRLEVCADRELLTTVLQPPDAETRRQVARIRQDAARVQALLSAGKYEDGLADARRVDADAQMLEFAPLHAETRHQLAELLRAVDAYDEAEAALIEAVQFAERGRHEEIRVRALLSLVRVADSRSRYEEGRRWLRVAEGALHRLGEAADLEHQWHHVAARIEIGRGDYAAAATAAQTALAGGEELHGPVHPAVARYLSTLALALSRQGRPADAFPHVERLAEIRLKTLGNEHPWTGAAMHALGAGLRRLGRLEEAEGPLRSALATCTRGFGEASRAVAIVRSDLGLLMLDFGRFGEAHEEFRQALEIRRSIYGTEHVQVAKALGLLGEAEMYLGRHAEAEETLREALRMRRATAGSRLSTVAFTLVNLGDFEVARQRYQAALEYYREARTVVEETLGSGHRLQAEIACGMGEAEAGRGNFATAVAELEASLGHPELRSPVRIAGCRFSLARALWQQGDDRPRSLQLAGQAADGYAAIGRAGQPVHRRITEWLASRDEAGG